MLRVRAIVLQSSTIHISYCHDIEVLYSTFIKIHICVFAIRLSPIPAYIRIFEWALMTETNVFIKSCKYILKHM